MKHNFKPAENRPGAGFCNAFAMIVFLFVVSSFNVSAQSGFDRCGTEPPPAGFETWMQSVVEQYQEAGERRMSVVTIPVVFHVIHNGAAVGAGTNLSYEQLLSQIEVINEDFRKMGAGFNNHLAGADIMLDFCLGGVNRVNANSQGWGSPPYTKCFIDSDIKPATIWSPTNFLNIWVISGINRCDSTGNLLGYSTWPEGSGLSGVPGNGGTINQEDGIVIRTSSVGRPPLNTAGGAYNLGRTATHELGHFFGLRHTWGDGDCSADDFCGDTPNCNDAFYGCTNPGEQCTDAGNRMIENYMDYTDDLCMNIFTNDQNTRIQAVLTNSPRRVELVNAANCCAEKFATAAVTSNYNGRDISCTGACDGSATVSTSGGTGPFTYLWSNGATSASITNLCAEIYTVTVTDARGCQVITSVTLNNPPPLRAAALAISDFNGYHISCHGGNDGLGEVTHDGGTGPFDYEWSDGQSTKAASNLTAGYYTVTVTDVNGCTDDAAVTLTEPDPLTLEAGENKTVYYGYPDSACAHLGASGISGGVSPYAVKWSTGETTDSITVCPASTTTYYLTLTDANGCTLTDSLQICVIDVRCGKKLNNISICHYSSPKMPKSKTLCVGFPAVATHLAHGDLLGDCEADRNCIFQAASKMAAQEGSYFIESFPNPFSRELTIRFVPGQDAHVSLMLYNSAGQQVESLFSGNTEAGNSYRFVFKADNHPDGLYVFRLLSSSGEVIYRKVILSR